VNKYIFDLQFLHENLNSFNINSSIDQNDDYIVNEDSFLNILFDNGNPSEIKYNYSSKPRGSLLSEFQNKRLSYRIRVKNPSTSDFYFLSENQSDGENIFSITSQEKDLISIYNSNRYLSIIYSYEKERSFSVTEYNTILSKLIYLKSKYKLNQIIDSEDLEDIEKYLSESDINSPKMKLVELVLNKLLGDILDSYRLDKIDLKIKA